jgi:type II secretory pathway component PulJ
MHPLSAITLIAEEKILEAQREGLFDNLPGSGKPLPPDDDARFPPELRMAYKILKNSGYLAENNRLEIKAENREETAEHGRLRRFAVLYGRMKKTGQKAAAAPGLAGESAAGLDAVLEAAVSKTLEDSPYFDKILKKF